MAYFLLAYKELRHSVCLVMELWQGDLNNMADVDVQHKMHERKVDKPFIIQVIFCCSNVVFLLFCYQNVFSLFKSKTERKSTEALHTCIQ